MHDWVLVTGAAHRLGREMALAFARSGWGVLCHYQRSEAAAQELVRDIQGLGVSAHAVSGALDTAEGVAQVFDVAPSEVMPTHEQSRLGTWMRSSSWRSAAFQMRMSES